MKIVARFPDRDVSRPMRMALMPSTDGAGAPQFLGIYMGEEEPAPGPVEGSTRPEPTREGRNGVPGPAAKTRSTPAIPAASGVAGSPLLPAMSVTSQVVSDQDLLDQGYERIRGARLISPTAARLAEMGELTDATSIRCIFMARRVTTDKEIRVYADVPGANPYRDLLFRLDRINESQAVEHHGVVAIPEAKAPGPPAVTPPTDATRAPAQPANKGGDEALLAAGYRRVTGLNVVHPKPGTGVRLPDTLKGFSIFNALDALTGEELHIYADVPGAFAMRDLLFLEESATSKDWWVERRGQVVLPGTGPAPGMGQDRSGPDTGPSAEGPRDPDAPESSASAEGSPGNRVRFQGRQLIYSEVLPRMDGTVEHFLILRVLDLDTRKENRVKIYTPDPEPLAFRDLTLEWARDGSGRHLCQTSDDPPGKWSGVDLSTLPWERLRVTGVKTITPEPEQRGEDWEEEWHIFQARDVKTGGVLKICGDVPGRDPVRNMTLIARPYRWWRGEMQYEGALIEPDPDVSPDVLISMIEEVQPPGLGEVLITRIVEKFGMEALYVIRYDPDLLEDVEGIGPGTIQKLKEADLDIKGALVTEMNRYGLSLRYFKTIMDTFQAGALDVVRNRPYDLIKAPNVPFRAIDELAVVRQNRSETSPERIGAVLSMTVEMMTRSGKSGDWVDQINEKAAGLVRKVRCTNMGLFLSLLWKRCLEESDKPDGIVLIDKTGPEPMVYFRAVVEAERRISKDLTRRARNGTDWRPFDPTQFLETYQKKKRKRLGSEQAAAVSMVCKSGVSIMTGGPGVGKTTTLDATIKSLESVGVNVVQMAPTGIASKRMSESTDRDANTIHAVIGKLERSTEEDPFIPRDCPTCVVIDETSMVNVMTLDKMLSNLPAHVSILFSGDVDQLPSIGPGEILRDLIRSEVFPVTRLLKVFRQTDGSGIIDAAKAINRGEFPKGGEDFKLIRISDPEQIADAIVQLCRNILEEGVHDVKRDLMVLSPVKKGPAGVVALNERLQALLNPPSPQKTELIMSRPVEEDTSTKLSPEEKKKARQEVRDYKETLRVGDRVIQTRNDTNRAMVNGDIGYITRISPQTQTIWVNFDGVEKMISRDQLKEIRLAYAMTVHKSQGSEARIVLFSLPPGYPQMMTKPLLYTGVTRASERVRVIGDEAAFRLCLTQSTDSSAMLARNTTLAQHCLENAIAPIKEHQNDGEGELDEDREPQP